MAFDADQRLAAKLRQGRFHLVIELNSPSSEQPLDSAVALAKPLAAKVAGYDDVAALAVTDRLRREASHDPVTMAEALMAASGKPVLMHLSGKGSDAERIRRLLGLARSSGIRNILAMTGDRSDQHPLKPGSGRPLAHPIGYRESIEIIDQAARADGFFTIGAVVNPFKYSPADQFLQYYKMQRKLATGAEFLVTHAGWDMKKLQELQWYLAYREIPNAVMARVLLLSVEHIRTLERTVWPGVHVSREFIAMLQRESDISASQCLAAQLPRIALQVAGCKLLGYSGVQIAGIRDAGTLEMVMGRLQQALETYTSYESWLEAWREHHGDMSFAPSGDAYYVFQDLMTPELPHYDPQRVRLTDRAPLRPGVLDRLRGWALPWVLSERAPEWLSTGYRALFRGADSTPAKALRHCFYLHPGQCPKHLVYGACGGSTPDGKCEFEHGPCFFHRVFALAAHRHELDRLEEPVSHD